jgi:hypothetical protein
LVVLGERQSNVDYFTDAELREKEVDVVPVLLLASFEFLSVLGFDLKGQGFSQALLDHFLKTVMEVFKVDFALSQELHILIDAALTALNILVEIDGRYVGDYDQHPIIQVNID